MMMMGVRVKLWDPLRTSAIPERFWGDVSRKGPISGVRTFIMRPSSLGGGRILRRTLSVRLSVCLSVRPSGYRYRASRRAT